MTAQVKIARNDARWFPSIHEALIEALDTYDLASKPDFARLNEMSENTTMEGLAVHTDSAIIENGKWNAPATLYVTLRYDVKSKDPVALQDSYPATVIFSVDDRQAVTVERVDIDVSSFYADSDAGADEEEAD